MEDDHVRSILNPEDTYLFLPSVPHGGLRVPALDLFLKLKGPIEFRNVRSQRCENRIRSQVLVKADFLSQGRFDQEGSVFGRRQARMSTHLRSQRNLRVDAYFVIAKGRLDVGRDPSGLRSKILRVATPFTFDGRFNVLCIQQAGIGSFLRIRMNCKYRGENQTLSRPLI